MDMGTGYNRGQRMELKEQATGEMRGAQGGRECTEVGRPMTDQGTRYQLGRALVCSGIRGAGWVDACASWGMGRQTRVAQESSGMTMRGQGCL